MPVTRFELELRRPLAGGKSFGEVGEYEELRGKLFFDVDPGHEANNRVGDIDLAQTNASRRVEFSSDVIILKPVEAANGNGRLLFDVLNRGTKVALRQFNNADSQLEGSPFRKKSILDGSDRRRDPLFHVAVEPVALGHRDAYLNLIADVEIRVLD